MFFSHRHKMHRRHRGMGDIGDFGGRPERGSRRKQFDGTSLRLILLRLIEQEPRHGYDLIRELEELSGGVYAPSPGVVYPTLTMLAEMGLTEEAVQEGSRKQFAITSSGSAHLAENHDAVELLFERIKRMGSDGATADHMPVMRALDNLNAVLRYRLTRDGAGVTTILDAAAQIDEAAQKIERL